ncbi:MAG: cation:proton antiporter, partial [Halobacteria archaeon]|nr:cation:proton antiporter [Halobacteria archaeon]
IDLQEIFDKGRFILKVATGLILLEALAGSLFIRFVFGTPWVVTVITALSFATVGEAVLLPILEEFELMETDLGQTIVGVGVVDDIFEIFTITLVSILLGIRAEAGRVNIVVAFGALVALFVLTYLVRKLPLRRTGFWFSRTEMSEGALFVFVLFVVFTYIQIGSYVDASAIGALLAGIAVENFIPTERFELVEDDVKAVTYGFFGPLFFLWVGIDASIDYLLTAPLLVVALILVVNATKIGGSYLLGKSELGGKRSVFMGVSLCVKFSTSIVLIKLLFERGLFGTKLYSVLIASTIAFKFLVPLLLAAMSSRWELTPSESQDVESKTPTA